MEQHADVGVVVLADDLSGAAETAAVLTSPAVRVELFLAPAEPGDSETSAGVTVVDLDDRHLRPADTARRLSEALELFAPEAGSRRILLKIDSLLRGHLPAKLAVLHARGGVVVAPALPNLRRVVRDGVLTVDGAALSTTSAWATDGRRAPATVAAALAPLPTALLDLSTVRSQHLASAIAQAIRNERVPVCDGETDADLDAVVAAVTALSGRLPNLAIAGSAGAAAALGRTWNAARVAVPARETPSAGPLVVVGTAEPTAASQVDLLAAAGFPEIRIPAAVLLSARPGAGWADRLAAAADVGPAVVRLDPTEPVSPSLSRRLSTGLAALVARAVQGSPSSVDLVLTGGETARRVLDALGVDRLVPLAEIEHGAVLSRRPDGSAVVTRPGSFGGPESLLTILGALGSHGRAAPIDDQRLITRLDGRQSMTLHAPTAGWNDVSAVTPLIAVTMGDGAGVGPEVVVGALIDEEIGRLCRPIVIGDAQRLRAAADILGVAADVVPVESVEDAEFVPGRINVIDLGLLPSDLRWGQLSAEAGHAAYEYIRVASELAVAGRVQAICTAPLNKEALHAAGHLFPGHTELLAHFTGTEEVSMLLNSPRIRVIHVTTHIGLLDAVAKIEPGLVERTVRRGHAALQRAGIAAPRIGVCGINPHAGENGLFGYGEEEEKIVPAIERLRADGIDARGPMPADTAFFVAGRGDYDLIVAMYHDQGHGPVKVLGIEAGVNVTVGLPVIRTSVDHGTAFDIAGTGKVEIGSMIEALRQAAQMAPSPSA
jgi:4-hydroxythreonine-4-phosphate dehydrogenase